MMDHFTWNLAVRTRPENKTLTRRMRGLSHRMAPKANGVVSISGSQAVRGNYQPFGILNPAGLSLYQTDTVLGSAFTSAQFGNVASLVVPTAGLYLCLGQVDRAALGSETATTVALSKYTGNTTTDHVTGVNVLHLGETAAAVASGAIFYVVTCAAGDTIYLKAATTGAVGDKITGALLLIKLLEA